jgi:hypothetical protein
MLKVEADASAYSRALGLAKRLFLFRQPFIDDIDGHRKQAGLISPYLGCQVPDSLPESSNFRFISLN